MKNIGYIGLGLRKMTIMYRTSCITQEDIGLIFVPDYKNEVVHSHTMTLKECIDFYCDGFDKTIEQYYQDTKFQEPR